MSTLPLTPAKLTHPAAITPPGPRSRVPGGVLVAFRRDRLGFLRRAARRYGDVAYFTLMGNSVYLLSHPDDIRDVLEVHHRYFRKGRGLERARKLLGRGLLTSEGELHERQRKLIMPAFHRERMAGYAGVMVDHAGALADRWRPGEVRDVAADMMHLTRGIVAESLFGYDVADRAGEIDAAMAALVGAFGSVSFFLPEWVVERGLWPSAKRLERARHVLDDMIYRMIRERRAAGGDRGDLLSMLLLATDDEGGRSMTDEQVRDEAMTLFLAGHETTSNALTWTWYLLSEHPEVEARMHDEIDRVLGGRPPAMDDVPALRYTRMVLTESMRLYPPAWVIGRRAAADYVVRGYGVPRGSGVLVSPWVVHRDPRFYPDPDRFDPERWRGDPSAQPTANASPTASRPKYAYLPFGGGPRRCIGEAFAWTEGVLILATIASRWRLRLVPGYPMVPEPLITLRPRHGARMTVKAR